MPESLTRPTNDYDPAWIAYNAANPHLRRSVGAAAADDPPPADPPPSDPPADPPPASPPPNDLSWAPEGFVKDNQLDGAALRTRFDELTAFKASVDERLAALPKDPSGYEGKVPEKFEVPEGITLPEDYVMMPPDKDDPDYQALQKIAHENQIPDQAFQAILQLDAVRQLRDQTAIAKEESAELAKLGDPGTAKARLDTVERTLQARLPAEQAKALSNELTTADAIRAVEQLLSKSEASTTTPHGRPKPGDLSIDDRLTRAFANTG